MASGHLCGGDRAGPLLGPASVVVAASTNRPSHRSQDSQGKPDHEHYLPAGQGTSVLSRGRLKQEPRLRTRYGDKAAVCVLSVRRKSNRSARTYGRGPKRSSHYSLTYEPDSPKSSDRLIYPGGRLDRLVDGLVRST